MPSQRKAPWLAGAAGRNYFHALTHKTHYTVKKFFRILGILLLIVVAAAGLLVAIAPQEYVVERSVTIKAPQTAVMARMTDFHTWPNWTAWGEMDPTQKHTFTGAPGTAGATYAWTGEEVGSGKMTSTAVTASAMNYNLDFIAPFESHNTGWVRTDAAADGSVRATMGMKMTSPRPWNALGWMMKGAVGDDFAKSLNKLKGQVEGAGQPVTTL